MKYIKLLRKVSELNPKSSKEERSKTYNELKRLYKAMDDKSKKLFIAATILKIRNLEYEQIQARKSGRPNNRRDGILINRDRGTNRNILDSVKRTAEEAQKARENN